MLWQFGMGNKLSLVVQLVLVHHLPAVSDVLVCVFRQFGRITRIAAWHQCSPAGGNYETQDQ